MYKKGYTPRDIDYTPRDIDHPDYFGDFTWAKVIGLGCVFLLLMFIIGVLF